MDKKGELTSKTLVITLLSIMGFALILIIYFNINWTGNVDRETCHQSVIFRATLPSAATNYVPLKCKTQKICITSGFFGGNCEKDFGNSGGVNIVKVSDYQQAEKIVTESIFDCWQMMGEGKVSVFSQFMAKSFALGNVYPSCVVCNRIAFDYDRLKKSNVQIERMDVENYMRTHLIPNGNITYYNFLTSEKGLLSFSDKLKNVVPTSESKANAEVVLEKQSGFLKSDIKTFESETIIQDTPKSQFDYSKDNMAIAFMQVSAPKAGDVFENTLMATAALTGGAAYTGALRVVMNPEGAIAALATFVGLNLVQQSNVVYQQSKVAGYCGDVSTGDDARYGCSVVRTMPYNVTDMNRFCKVIESIP